jgi:hypothetical protein
MSLYAAHQGYVYQDLAVACFLAEAIIHGYDEIKVDRKVSSTDDFDDLTLRQGDLWLRRQFKHSQSHVFSEKDLQNGTIRLDELVRSHVLFPNRDKVQYQLCLAWNSPEYATIKDYLIQQNLTATLPGLVVTSYRINSQYIWPKDGTPVWKELQATDIRREDFIDLCNRLSLQMDWPKASLDLASPGVLETVLIDLLQDKIGVGQYPNENRIAADVASALVRLATLFRSSGHTTTPNEIIQQLRLRTDFGKIAQQFPFKKDKYVHRKEFQTELLKTALTSNTILSGPPGSGKSWSLTQLEEDLTTAGAVVAKHYCFLEPGDPNVQIRITVKALYGNLIASIIDAVPDLLLAKKSMFAADADELERILRQAANQLTDRELVLIVDGLDHIARVFLEATHLSHDEIDIVNDLASLDLPEKVHLIIGSQPGEHLDPLRELKFKELSVPEWVLQDTQLLATKNKLLDHLNISPEDYDQIIRKLHERSEGNPLYATFLIKTIVTLLSKGAALDLIMFLDEAPALEGDISKYYEHLLKTTENKTAPILARLLGLLDFAVTPRDLRDIYPPFSAFIDETLSILAPVLTEVEGQGGVRIYHESFRRYIISTTSNTEAAYSDILAPAIEWLANKGFYRNAKAYRFLLQLLKRIGHNGRIKELVSNTFVADSIAAGHPEAAIAANLAIAADAASNIQDWGFLARLSELSRALHTCFEEKLTDIELYANAFAAIYGREALAERLLFDGKPTVSTGSGLRLCSLLEEGGVTPPWLEYLKGKIETGNTSLPDDERRGDAIDAAIFHGVIATEGIDVAFGRFQKWISNLSDSPRRYYLGLLIKLLLKYSEKDITADLVKLVNFPDARRTIRIQVIPFLIEQGKREAAQSIIREYCSEINIYELLEYLPFDLQLDCIPKADIPETGSFDISIEKEAYSTKEDQVGAWLKIVNLLAYVDPGKLKPERNRVSGLGWYRAWLFFAIDLVEFEILSKKNENQADEAIAKALDALSADIHPFVGSPRTCDLYGIRGIIRDTFERALELLKQRHSWESALPSLVKISQETTTYLQNSPGGPLVAQELIELLLPYAENVEISDLILKTIEELIKHSERKGQFYEIHAEHEMTFLIALAKAGSRAAAEDHWIRAAQYLSSYGFRKDTTIYEIIDCLPSIGNISVSTAKSMLTLVQPLTDRVVEHTDGKETKYAHNSWFKSLLNTDSKVALGLLAHSLRKHGGVIDWRLESALDDSFDTLQSSIDPEIYLCLQFAQPFSYDRNDPRLLNNRVRQCLRAIESMINSKCGRKNTERFFKKLVTHVLSDGEELDHRVFSLLVTFQNNHDLHEILDSDSKQQGNIEEYIKRGNDWLVELKNIDKVSVFPRDVTPFQLMSILKKRVLGTDERSINAFGYRLIELLDQGHGDQVNNLINAYARYLSLEPLKALGGLAEGLLRHGHKEAAAHCFANTFIYARGGGGWKTLGDREYHPYFVQAINLSGDAAFKKLVKYIAGVIKNGGYSIGITSNLIELFCHLNKLDHVEDIWHEAYNVIRNRLPEQGTASGPFSQIELIKPMSNGDAAALDLLIARIDHPEYRRKIGAISGLAYLFKKGHLSIPVAFKEQLWMNSPVSSLVALLSLLDETEPIPTVSILAISDQLISLSTGDHFTLRNLAKRLLNKGAIDTSGHAKLPDTPTLSTTLNKKREEAILSLDFNDRLDDLSFLKSDYPSIVARRFELVFNNQTCEEIEKSRYEAAYNRNRLYHTSLLFWHDELFDVALNDTGFELIKELWRRGDWSEKTEKEIVKILSPNLDIVISSYESRIARPYLDKPSQVIETITDVPVINDSMEYNGWHRVAFYETELLGDYIGGIKLEIRSMGGAVFSPDIDSGSIHPFGDGSYKIWRNINGKPNEDLNLLGILGPLVGFDFFFYYSFKLPIFMLPQELAEQLSLSLGVWPGPLHLADGNNNPAAVYHWWWSSPFGDSIGEEIPKLFGSQLLLRPDIYERINNASAFKPRYVIRTRE